MTTYMGRATRKEGSHSLGEGAYMAAVFVCTGGLDPRGLKTALFCISFLRKGEMLAYVGHIHNLKDLIDHI